MFGRNKAGKTRKTLTTLITVIIFTTVQQASAATLFAVVLSADDVDGTGWLAGYVVYGSGTYTLSISASGSKSSFPITSVRVIACVSNEAQAGGVESITVEGTPISTYTQGVPAPYGACGGPLQRTRLLWLQRQLHPTEPSTKHHPENAKNVQITVQFSGQATETPESCFLSMESTTGTGP